MTDQEHAAILRSSIDALRLGKHERAALERAIELLSEGHDDPMLWSAQNEPES